MFSSPSPAHGTPDGQVSDEPEPIRSIVEMHRVVRTGVGFDVVTDLLTIVDHGTGHGKALADALHSDRCADLGPEAQDGDALELVLRPTEHERWLKVLEPGALEPTHWPVRFAVDRALRMVTSLRLDDLVEPPRLHAAAVADDDGQAVVLIGQTGAGKSTLTTHLVHGGLDLMSDEQVALHAVAGRVAAFTRPIEIKGGGGAFLPAGMALAPEVDEEESTHLDPTELRRRHRLLGRPALLVLVERSHEPTEASWEMVDSSKAVEALCSNNLDFDRSPLRALEAYAWLATTVPAIVLRFYDSADGAALIRNVLADPPLATGATWTIDVASGPPRPLSEADEDPYASDGGRLQVRPGVFTVSIDDSALLVDPETRFVARLNAGGAATVRSLPGSAQDDATAEFLEELRIPGFLAFE